MVIKRWLNILSKNNLNFFSGVWHRYFHQKNLVKENFCAGAQEVKIYLIKKFQILHFWSKGGSIQEQVPIEKLFMLDICGQ